MNKPRETTPAAGLYQAQYGHFIGGQWVEGASGATIDLMNPATGERLSRIAAGNAKDAERAVAAAAEAFKTWGHSSPAQRQEVLIEIARRLKARAQDFALLETLNNGKPIREALHFDVPAAIGQFELFAGADEVLLGALASAFGALFERNGWKVAELRGIGFFTAVDAAAAVTYVLGLIFGVAFLGEPVGWGTLVGLAIILCSVVLVTGIDFGKAGKSRAG